jgi:hypothetical protein
MYICFSTRPSFKLNSKNGRSYLRLSSSIWPSPSCLKTQMTLSCPVTARRWLPFGALVRCVITGRSGTRAKRVLPFSTSFPAFPLPFFPLPSKWPDRGLSSWAVVGVDVDASASASASAVTGALSSSPPSFCRFVGGPSLSVAGISASAARAASALASLMAFIESATLSTSGCFHDEM